MYHMYNAYLRYCGSVDHPGDCDAGCEVTEDPPPTEWPEGYWPFYLDDGWELVEIAPD